MTQAIDGTGTRTYTYDALGRKTYQTDPRGNTTATYDAASRLLSQTDVTNRLIEYDYDPNGRMELVEDPSSWATYEYDTRGRMKKETFSNGVYSNYGYDNASRLTTLHHKKVSDGSLILGYSATYDAASRLMQAVESPTTATTSYVYDNANRLTSEDRTGANPYLSDYTYNSLGLRATAFRSEGGVTSHDGTYTYDDAARLTQVVEEADGPSSYENYTWNNDNTLASYPGPGYTRILDYDEEGRLTKISRLTGGVTTPKFEYAYGFDGGRRWRKDLDGDVWNWYPCGVACCAGELVVLEATISGTQTWTAASSILPAVSGASHDGSAFTTSPTSFLSREVASGSSLGSVTADQFGFLRSTTGTGSTYYGGWLPSAKDDEARTSVISGLGMGCNAPKTLEPGSEVVQNEPFTNADCLAACKALFEKAKLVNICNWVCKTLKGKTCSQLFSYCMHLKRGGLPSKKKTEICMILHNAMCPNEPRPCH